MQFSGALTSVFQPPLVFTISINPSTTQGESLEDSFTVGPVSRDAASSFPTPLLDLSHVLKFQSHSCRILVHAWIQMSSWSLSSLAYSLSLSRVPYVSAWNKSVLKAPRNRES
ncbi:hypothetical protein B0H16DRAFT_504213 [Mycena metata]|uniref:Uncharacterized protein n=1 Tax=Mycena metata TaxID=1033252 RepID=A0AAD7JGP7_9AGAR|nr:hypothetical protein B0H16DRAFT_504213 [Mycena metata]